MFVLDNLKEFQDGYKLEQVNCIEKPMLILLNNYNEVYFHLLLAFHKLVQSYHIEKYDKKDVLKMRTLRRLQVILEEELKIKLVCANGFNNVIDFIKQQLKRNNPVIVQTDLYELYYSEHYKDNHWLHSILVYGYNERKNLLYIIDAIQQNNNGYQKFYITEDMVERLYDSMNRNIYSEGIYYVDSNTVNIRVNKSLVLSFVKNCVSYLCDNSSNCRCRILTTFFDCMDFLEKDKNDLARNIIRQIKYKEVFYNELEWLFRYIELREDIVNGYCNVREELINKWKKVSGKIVYHICRLSFDSIRVTLQELKSLERKMFEYISKIKLELEHLKISDCINVHDYFFEHNEDGIISKIDKDVFAFNFDNGKLYDNWIDDCAPRISLSKLDFSQNKPIKVTTKLRILNYDETSSYIAGFYIKTKNQSRYMCGINSGIGFSIDQSGVNTCVFSVCKCSFYSDIKIEVVDNLININCIDMYSGETIINHSLFLDDSVCELGLSCKTWGFYRPLKIVFESFVIS